MVSRGTGQNRRQGRKHVGSPTLVIVVSVVAAVVWIALMTFWIGSVLAASEGSPTSLRIPEPARSKDNVHDLLPVSPLDIWPDDTETYDLFRTLKDCDPTSPNSKCNEPVGLPAHRVGILSPPGAVSDFVTSWVASAVKFHSAQEENQEVEIVLLNSSHVPAYGYGRSHGYQKIIRIASFPMSLAAADTVQFALASVSGDRRGAQLEDMKEVSRQVVRWHCRLSHVAAHTPLMTVTMEKLIEDPWEIEEQLCGFLGLTKRESGEMEEVDEGNHMDEDELMQSVEPILDHASDLLNKVDRESGTESMEKVLNYVIAEELKATNDLSAWPCESFWTVGEKRNPLLISPVARRIAQTMAPECSSEHVSCGVKRDKCEERGDALCKD